MDGIPVPGIPDGSDLNIEEAADPEEKTAEKPKSVFDRDSDLNPSFAIDPIQEEKAWEKREKAETISD